MAEASLVFVAIVMLFIFSALWAVVRECAVSPNILITHYWANWFLVEYDLSSDQDYSKVYEFLRYLQYLTKSYRQALWVARYLAPTEESHRQFPWAACQDWVCSHLRSFLRYESIRFFVFCRGTNWLVWWLGAWTCAVCHCGTDDKLMKSGNFIIFAKDG